VRWQTSITGDLGLWDLDVSFDGLVWYRDINHIDDIRLECYKSVIMIESDKCNIRTF